MRALTFHTDDCFNQLLKPMGTGTPAPVVIGASPSFRRVEDKQFVVMERAYTRTGGLETGDCVAALLRRRSNQPISTLARWIVDRRIVSFNWQAKTLIPLFQFDLATMSLRSSAVDVVQELVSSLDDWNLSLWFAQPNGWLDDAAPVDVIAADPMLVLQAARAGRIIRQG